MRENMMPNPEQLKKTQDENMSEKQIAQSEEREKTFMAGARFVAEKKSKLDRIDFYKKNLKNLREYLKSQKVEMEERKKLLVKWGDSEWDQQQIKRLEMDIKNTEDLIEKSEAAIEEIEKSLNIK